MRFKAITLGAAISGLLLCVSCNNSPQTTSTPTLPMAPKPTSPRVAAPLPDSAFKAQITLNNPPEKLRVGEKVTLEVKVRNTSDIMWYARGGETNPDPNNKFYLAAGNRWLASDEKLVTNMDGRYGLDKNLKPGEETVVPLQVSAPKEPGDYLLDVDVVQEGVAWFSDKGSATARTKVVVVR